MGRGALVAIAALLLCAAPAAAAPGSGPTAVVTMGDSYISGEGGRWAGNSTSTTPGNDGTDRACRPAGATCQVDTSQVYLGGSDANGCHRSDVAEVLSASLPVAERVNIACSGAVTGNLVPAEGGGVGQNGEPPQGDQLATVARRNDVEAIVVSIGGNDLGFAGIVGRCLAAYNARTGPCEPSEQPRLAAMLPEVTTRVGNVVDAIRGVMRGAGYADDGYRLILQTYPSVVGRASENRYAEDDPRRSAEGCASYDTDLDWARDRASRQIGDVVVAAAQAKRTELLDLRDLFQGHEVCARTAAQSTPLASPEPAGAEWGRFLSPSTVQQGQLQEAVHPNAFGQQAIGACLTGAFAAAPGTYTCTGAGGAAPGAVTFARTGDLPAGAPVTTRPGSRPRLRLSIRRVQRRRAAVCYAVRVRAGGKAVRRATVRFAGTRKRTNRRGRATLCGRPRAGQRRITASKPGFRAGSRAVRIRRR